MMFKLMSLKKLYDLSEERLVRRAQTAGLEEEPAYMQELFNVLEEGLAACREESLIAGIRLTHIG